MKRRCKRKIGKVNAICHLLISKLRLMNEDFKPRNRKGRILPREVANEVVSIDIKML